MSFNLQKNTCNYRPPNWIPGMPVLEPAPNTYQKLKDRVSNLDGKCCFDWYLCFTESNKCLNDGKMPQLYQMNNMDKGFMNPNDCGGR